MRVEVIYGEHDLSEAGRGYAYDDRGLGAQVGDIVLVPTTWLNELRGSGMNGQVATVCALGSDYDGHASSILRIVERAADRKRRMKQQKRLASAYRRAAKQLGEEHPEAAELLRNAALELGSSR